ncbi:conserved hypothetical protein [Talaromyces stipitatus ATCC 10500]|uniref:DDE-1 domain-containing protein n=1 Tax=Talaromyces stipitatus (strain ATCC 10500 / CBS 375.48 / QM 6759 / NRRL 1006) TaxID=441959 RepID=B8MU51_TALSN|nr:uncharacterized protein TSTA_109480 [Talaromyces stipitatus ATCC 10500]EED11769.1 conserved hypothetical protein [Talaromyces stipitatus ATCC 10500]
MKFIEHCDSNRILLAIFPTHASHTLQPLDVAIFSPLSNAYTKQLDDFINDSQVFTRLTKRDFFRLFRASWNEVFTSKNINSAFKHTGLYSFNPEIVIQKFSKKIASRPLSSLPSEQDGGALFMIPTKVQQARGIISQKNDEAVQEQARKDDKKLRQQLAKQAKEAEKIERARIQQEKREQREQEAAEKQRLKNEQELAKLAYLQVQKDVISTPKASKRPTKASFHASAAKSAS